MDNKAFYKLSYGLFLLTARQDGRDNGCIINTAIQAANDPKRLSICVINKNLTREMIDATGVFNVSVLTEDVPFEVYKRFGMQSGRDADKFAGCAHAGARTENGLRYAPEAANAVFSCKVTESRDLGSHTLYIGEVTEAMVLSNAPSATYAYYQSHVKPRPAAAPSKSGWRCKVCGYIYEGETLPADFVCPLCKHGAEDFERIEASVPNSIINEGEKSMKKFVCKVCGYIYEGEAAPAECPVCHAAGKMFEEVVGELKLAAEHEYGIYAKTVKDNKDISDADKAYILEQLKANFNGECAEVGMYLCMARIAHREGYPEVGLYWEKAAYEEAEHAAKFAELLGEELEPNMKASTKANLAWRVDCEFGATQGKFDLASCAKKNGLDAIHDTVHEMARDEARHGKALKGLLERYFK